MTKKNWISLSCFLLSCVLATGVGINNFNQQQQQQWSKQMGVLVPNFGQGYGNAQQNPLMEEFNIPVGREDGFNDFDTDYERANNPKTSNEQMNQWDALSVPPKNFFSSPYSVVPDWPASNRKMGQISAVCFDREGNVIVFHRGDHVWNTETFLDNQTYNKKELGPIEDNTVITFDSVTGKVVGEWGSNLFFLPHGLTVDSKSNIWVTDVALHQVFKFPPKGGSGHPTLVLGTRFEPGNDDTHFCKPTAVAVTSGGDFFVSDGYCNHRIIKFSADGKKLLVWGRSTILYGQNFRAPPPNAFSIPHALALAEDRGVLCVADRENGRILCFNITSGLFISQIKLPEFGSSKIFSIAYSPVQGGLLYAVTGDLAAPSSTPFLGFVIGLSSRQLVTEFSPSSQGFSTAHDVTVSSDGKQIYVIELNPSKVWKFVEDESGALSQFPSTKLKNIKTTDSTMSQPTLAPTTTQRQLVLSDNNKEPISSKSMTTIEVAPHQMSLSLQVLIAISTIIALAVVATVFICIRRKGPWCSYWMCYKRWQFRRDPSDGFKLGSLLDPHPGFEQVCTEMSDEEEIDATTITANNGNGTGIMHLGEMRA